MSCLLSPPMPVRSPGSKPLLSAVAQTIARRHGAPVPPKWHGRRDPGLEERMDGGRQGRRAPSRLWRRGQRTPPRCESSSPARAMRLSFNESSRLTRVPHRMIYRRVGSSSPVHGGGHPQVFPGISILPPPPHLLLRRSRVFLPQIQDTLVFYPRRIKTYGFFRENSALHSEDLAWRSWPKQGHHKS